MRHHALAHGSRLGVYAITAQIGVGGMGEVYRATEWPLLIVTVPSELCPKEQLPISGR